MTCHCFRWMPDGAHALDCPNNYDSDAGNLTTAKKYIAQLKSELAITNAKIIAMLEAAHPGEPPCQCVPKYAFCICVHAIKDYRITKWQVEADNYDAIKAIADGDV